MGAISFEILDQLTQGRRGTFDVPCPECGPGRRSLVNRRRRVLRVWRNDPGFITYKCARCPASGYAHAPRDWEPGDEQDRRVHPSAVRAHDAAEVGNDTDLRLVWTDDQQRRIDAANRIWNEAGSIRGTLAETYLLRVRGIGIVDRFDGSVLRFHPACPWRDENTGRNMAVPALIARFDSVDDGTPLAIHRIALRPDGTKLDRRMLGVMHRTAVRLGSPHDGVLAIAEGVETALAAIEMFGLSCAWACGSAGAVSHFPIIDGIHKLILLGENNKAGVNACNMTGTRWRRGKRQVEILSPSSEFDDFNDALVAQKERSYA